MRTRTHTHTHTLTQYMWDNQFVPVRYEQYVEDAYVEYLKQHNRPDEVRMNDQHCGTPGVH